MKSEIKNILSVSPIDGRSSSKTEVFSNYFSEYALIKYRVYIEIEYFIALCELKLPELIDFDPSNFKKLRNLYENFSTDYAVEIKQIEKITNHDIKALEYLEINEPKILILNLGTGIGTSVLG